MTTLQQNNNRALHLPIGGFGQPESEQHLMQPPLHKIHSQSRSFNRTVQMPGLRLPLVTTLPGFNFLSGRCKVTSRSLYRLLNCAFSVIQHRTLSHLGLRLAPQIFTAYYSLIRSEKFLRVSKYSELVDCRSTCRSSFIATVSFVRAPALVLTTSLHKGMRYCSAM